MDLRKEERLRQMLDSVEKEEQRQEEIRPRGDFARQLFHESDDESLPDDPPDDEADTDYDSNEELENEEIPEDDEYFEFPTDFDVLEDIPLQIRKEAETVQFENGRKAYFSKDRKMLWYTEPVRRGRLARRNVILMRVGHVHATARDAKTPLDVWGLYFDKEILNEIVVCTNIWIEKNKVNYSRERDCLETSVTEIKAVFGILYMAGVLKAAHLNLEDLWSTDGLGVEFFRACMSIKRFKFLLRALRFDDINTRNDRRTLDNLAPIRRVFENLVEKCKKYYVPSEFVTIDEMLESFRGRCRFRQYIKNKPAKYGVKIFSMVCAKSFYVSNMEIYAGKQPEGPFRVQNSGKCVVERLVQPITGSGRNVTVDNWFCSIPLCLDLQNNHRLTLVGTLRQDKREIPPPFRHCKEREVGSNYFGFKPECTMVSYKAKPNKTVVLLSSMHDNDMVDNDEESRTFGKPDIILFYNATKGGVDTVDQYKGTYSVARKTNRWSMVVFYSLLNVMALNSFIILKKNLNKPEMRRRKFLRDLSMDLCKEFMISRLTTRSLPQHAKRRIRQIMGIDEPQRDAPAEEVTKGRCYLCDRKKNRPSQTRCGNCKFFICKEHSAPAQCVNCVRGDEEMEISDDE